MTEHEVRIVGTAARPEAVDGRALERTLRSLVEGAAKAVRLVGEGRSTARATPPEWVIRCSTFEVRPIASRAARTFAFKVDDAPLSKRDARFRQLDFLEEAPNQNKSGIALFEDALEAALSGAIDSGLLDDGMLGAVEGLGKVFQHGVERVDLVNARVVSYTPEGLRTIERMKRSIPRPNHVRVAGKLETLRHTKHRFLLVLDDGSSVAGIAEQVEDEYLKPLWGRKVVVEGTAHYFPTGKIQRIEAARVAPATAVDESLFSTRPLPLFGGPEKPLATTPVKAGDNWLDALWGKWPGDESPEEIALLLGDAT